MINKNLGNSIASRNVNLILVWIWNNPTLPEDITHKETTLATTVKRQKEIIAQSLVRNTTMDRNTKKVTFRLSDT